MDFDSLDGYDELSSEQQQKVREAVERGHVADEDWKGVRFSLWCLILREFACTMGLAIVDSFLLNDQPNSV